MSTEAEKPITGDPGSIQEGRQAFRDRLVRALERMDDELKNPDLTPDQRYAIASPLLFWLE